MAPAGGGNIKVVVRVRPFNSRGEFGLQCGASIRNPTNAAAVQ